ncbi:amino acid transporter [Arthrobacter sp. ERGS1:01]|nr:amino acid transporter [Arthrobacter sp. ERGS1:01]
MARQDSEELSKATPRPGSQTKGLRGNSLGLARSMALGLAAVAPAYSLAVTLGFVVVAVGQHTPAAFVLGFIPILLTAFAFRDLNSEMPDCGGNFVWTSRVFGPTAGWFLGGWITQIASFISMAALAQVATTYFLQFLGLGSLADNALIVSLIGCTLIILSTLVAVRGIEIAAWLQYVLIALQLVAIGGFCVGAFVHAANGSALAGAETPTLDWLNPFNFGDLSGLTQGVLLCLFIYWGWDALISVNEETTDSSRTPGRAVVLSTIILLACYGTTSFAALAYAGSGSNGIGAPNIVGDVFSALGPGATGPIFGKIIVLAVGLSALAAMMTVTVSTPRMWLSMSVFKALPARLSRIHPVWKTPYVATLWCGGLSIVVLIGLTLIAPNFIGDAILSVGLLIAAYYGATAVACVIYFRKQFRSPKALLVKGILPGAGALLMAAAFVISAIDMFSPSYVNSSWLGIGTVFWIGVGALVLGIVVVLVIRPALPGFFRQNSLPQGDVNSPPLQLRVTENLEIKQVESE